LTSALAGGEWSASHPGRFTPGEIAPGTHWVGGWVDSRAGLDDVGKILDYRDSNPGPTVIQPIAGRCTDYANYTYVGFEVLTAVVMKSTIFWDITPCSPLRPSAHMQFLVE
jgi:hypothetical protein